MNFNELNIDLKGKTSGQIKTKCPKCHHKRKRKMTLALVLILTKDFIIVTTVVMQGL